MTALLQAELVKLRTTRTFVVFVILAVGISVVLAGLVAALTEPTADSVVVDVFSSDVSSLFVLILAIIGITGEWRHRTITSALLAAPDRPRFLAAKTLAYAVAGLVLSLAVALGITVVGFAVLLVRDLPTPDVADLAELYGRNALMAMLLAALGVGIGAVVPNQPVAIVAVFVVAFVVEPALLALVPDAGHFGPLTVLPTAVTGAGDEAGFDDADLIPPGFAVLAMLAWIGVWYAAGAALLRFRDVD